jgi:mannose/fructose/sorbose-specific phosphotransferase system IIA component
MTKLLIMTHGDLGASMLASATSMLGLQADCATLALTLESGREDLAEKARAQLALWEGDVLILVDMLGGTPWNVGLSLAAQNAHIDVLSGMSLPLLLEALTLRATLGARELGGVLKEMAAPSVVQASHLLKGSPEL